MADLTITPANVQPGSSGVPTRTLSAKVTVTAGQAVYNNGGQWDLAQGTSAALAGAGGIALASAAPGQPLTAQTGGLITIGAAVVPGQAYVVSAANAGGVAPVTDMLAGNFPTLLGLAPNTTQIQLKINQSGVAHG